MVSSQLWLVLREIPVQIYLLVPLIEPLRLVDQKLKPDCHSNDSRIQVVLLDPELLYDSV